MDCERHLSRLSGLETVIKRAALFLLFLFTDSYAAIREQQSFPLFPDCGVRQVTSAGDYTKDRYKKSSAFPALFIYGLLCRNQGTAIFPAVS